MGRLERPFHDKAPLSSERHPARIDGQPHCSSGAAFAAAAVNGDYQLAESQPVLPEMGSHVVTISAATMRALWGVYPISDLISFSAGFG